MENRDDIIQGLQRAFSNDNSPRNEVEAAMEKRVDEIKEALAEGRVTEEHLLGMLVEERSKTKNKSQKQEKGNNRQS